MFAVRLCKAFGSTVLQTFLATAMVLTHSYPAPLMVDSPLRSSRSQSSSPATAVAKAKAKAKAKATATPSPRRLGDAIRTRREVLGSRYVRLPCRESRPELGVDELFIFMGTMGHDSTDVSIEPPYDKDRAKWNGDVKACLQLFKDLSTTRTLTPMVGGWRLLGPNAQACARP